MLDNAEISLPNAGILHLEDPETGQKFSINTASKKVREKYAKLIKETDDKLINEFSKAANRYGNFIHR